MSKQEIANGMEKTEAQIQLSYHSMELRKLNKMTNPSKAKVLYHANCIREIAQAHSVHKKFNKETK